MKKKVNSSLKNFVANQIANIYGRGKLAPILEEKPAILAKLLYSEMRTIDKEYSLHKISNFLNGKAEKVNKDFLQAISLATNTPTAYYRENFNAGKEKCTASDFEKLDLFDISLNKKLHPEKEPIQPPPPKHIQKEKLFN